MSEDSSNKTSDNVKKEKEIITTAVGDFILRWGIWGMVVLLILASAYSAKDFEKRRITQVSSVQHLLKKETLDIQKKCEVDLKEKILKNSVESGDSKVKQKELENALKILAEKNFNINDVAFMGKKSVSLKKQMEKIPDNLYYEILLCHKKEDYLNKIEVIK